MQRYLVEFFDLANQWWDSTTVLATNEQKARDQVRRDMGKGFVRFRAIAI